ncbi:MAG: hypothetical protein Q9182_006398 [Xanthomendoza sp. 2 TL-2023]
MGRKPNQLVNEYFDRGAKLKDNSNRYEHTCKACGKRFPKGRIESLTAHVEKNCPSIRREDRIRILSEPNLSLPPASHDNGNGQSVGDTTGLRAFTEHQTALPVSSSRSLTGLEALAEASRQLEHPAKSGFSRSSQSQLIDPDLEKAYSNPTSSRLDTGFGEHGNYIAHTKAATDESYVLSHAPTTKPQAMSGQFLEAGKGAQDPGTLSFIAASATCLEAGLPLTVGEQPAHDQTSGSQGSAIPQPFASEAPLIDCEDNRNKSFTESIGVTGSGQHVPHVIEPCGNTTHIRPRVYYGPNDQSRASEKSHARAQKVRGKFTDSRRQEVQEIRKKGACIRCRMLRKTVLIPWTPAGKNRRLAEREAVYWRQSMSDLCVCHQCQGVEIGLHEDKHPQGVGHIPHGSLEQGQCFIQFAHADNDINPLTFVAQLEGRKGGQSLEAYEFDVTNLASKVVFLDETTDRICAKLLPYMQATVSHASLGEPPLLSRQTFSMAAESKVHGSLPTQSILKQGANPITQDKLLAQTFDLWYLIHIISSTPDDWHISGTSPDDSSNKVQPRPTSADASRDIGTDSSPSQQIITIQMQAAAEQGASDISKNIMVELERRLERKERCQNFETFFVGIILLNCAERTSWALKRASYSDHPEDVSYRLENEFDFLSKLYEMRGILLDVRPNAEDGMLHASSGSSEIVDQWLSDLRLTKNETVLESTAEQAGSPSTPQQPQKAVEQHQAQPPPKDNRPADAPVPNSASQHGSLATPAVRGLLKDLKIDIREVTGTGKDGRVLKEDVQNHASTTTTVRSNPSHPPPSTPNETIQHETPIPLTPMQTQMFKTMTRSLTIPHFYYTDELNITALSTLRTHLNTTSPPDQPKLSYLPFILKALSLALTSHPLLNSRLDTQTDPSRPQLLTRTAHNIGIAIDTPQGLLVPNIKNVHTLSITSIATELTRLRSLALSAKLTPADLTGGTITVSNIGSIGGMYVNPLIASPGKEVAILGIGKKRVVPGFDEEGGLVRRREVMCFSWGADHRVVDGATVARCAEVVRGFVEEPGRMVVRLR